MEIRELYEKETHYSANDLTYVNQLGDFVVSEHYFEWLENKAEGFIKDKTETPDNFLTKLLEALMEAIEKENMEENVCGVRIHTNDGCERRLEDIAMGYEMRFEKILENYFTSLERWREEND
jgi:hypothetical protein